MTRSYVGQLALVFEPPPSPPPQILARVCWDESGCTALAVPKYGLCRVHLDAPADDVCKCGKQAASGFASCVECIRKEAKRNGCKPWA